MFTNTNFEKLRQNLIALGARRLLTLGLSGLAIIGVAFAAAMYLSRPTTDVLYSGLDRNDVAAIGDALKQSGIAFDVSADGATVYTPIGQTSLARMTLAERGLPHSGGMGNELYDKLGSLGLTSFMQEVTKLRAMEGELSRTVQMMQGVRAARVHIVLPEEGSFRRERKNATASVLLRTSGGDDRQMADTIRKLVAAAVPGMKSEDVTVLNVDGRLMASGPDTFERTPDNLLAMERQVTGDIRERIAKTLTPYLSSKNFQVSVAAQLNTDQKKTNETTYDPESRVGRTVRVVKEHQTSQNAAGQQGVGVDTNVPRAKTGGDSKSSNDEKTKREETTTYEVSSRSTVTTKNGYSIDGLSIALMINRPALSASLGGKASADDMAKQVAEIEQVVARAAGIRKERGDAIKISIVEFTDSGRDLEPVPAPSYLEIASRQAGSVINGLIFLAIIGLVLIFAVRPALKLITPEPAALVDTAALPAPRDEIEPQAAIAESDSIAQLPPGDSPDRSFEAALLERRDKVIQKQLEQLVDFDEEHAAVILAQWIREGVPA